MSAKVQSHIAHSKTAVRTHITRTFPNPIPYALPHAHRTSGFILHAVEGFLFIKEIDYIPYCFRNF